MLRVKSGSQELVEALVRDPDSVALPPAEKAMLRFALKLHRYPAAMEVADVAALREHGFTDENILDIVLSVAYRNFLIRLVEGTGVSLPVELAPKDPAFLERMMVGRSLTIEPAKEKE